MRTGIMVALDEAVRMTTDDPKEAVEFFFNQLDDPLSPLLLQFVEPPGFAHWTRTMIGNYEAEGNPVLISGRWGDVWLCPADTPYYRSLTPEAPLVTPRGLRTLGRAIIDHLAKEPSGLFPWDK